jgi:tetratricopeptide (TPR) repeat protein
MRKTWNCSGYFLPLLVCWFLFYSPITLARAGICRISTQPTELLGLVCRALTKRADLVYARQKIKKKDNDNNNVIFPYKYSDKYSTRKGFRIIERVAEKLSSKKYSTYINVINIVFVLFLIFYLITINKKNVIDKNSNNEENDNLLRQIENLRRQIFYINLHIDQNRRYLDEEISALDESIKRLHAQRLLDTAAYAIEYERVYNLASQRIDEALEAKPADHATRARAQALTSQILRRTRRFEEAYGAIHDALEYVPDHPLYLYDAACCSALLERSDEALGLLARCFEHEPALRARALQEPELATVRELPEFLNLCLEAYQGKPQRLDRSAKKT